MKNFLFLLSVLFVAVSFGQTAKDYYKQAEKKHDLQDYRGALVDYTKAIELDPTNAAFYNNRSIFKRKLKDYTGSIEDCTEAIDLNPKYAVAYINRGDTKFMISDIDGACLDWSKAGELGYSIAYDKIKEYCK